MPKKIAIFVASLLASIIILFLVVAACLVAKQENKVSANKQKETYKAPEWKEDPLPPRPPEGFKLVSLSRIGNVTYMGKVQEINSDKEYVLVWYQNQVAISPAR